MRKGMFVGLLLLQQSMIMAAATAPTDAVKTCIIQKNDADRLRNAARPIELTRGFVVLKPCRGDWTGTLGAVVWYVDADGISRQIDAAPGQPLEVHFRNLKTHDPLQPDSFLTRLFSGASRRPGAVPSYSRFDPRDGAPIQGFALPGGELQVPLAWYGWNPAQAVRVEVGPQSLLLQPDKGVLRIPRDRLGIGAYRLTQGALTAGFEVQPEAALAELRAELQRIDEGTADAATRRWRRIVWLAEQGYELDAVDEHGRP